MKAVLSIVLLMCMVAVFQSQAQEITCPDTNPRKGDKAILFPHPTNCKHYFVCDFGRAIVMKCPVDLHFNPVEKVCDYPWKAGCTAH